MQAIDIVFIVFFGLLWGSFLNVCIYRIPRGNFWSSQRSFCPHCKAQIPFYLNLPLVSYLSLLGKSACCRKPIRFQYPAVEFLTALLLTILFLRIGVPLTKFHQIDHNNLMRLLHGFFFISIMMVCSFIDIEFMIIPDKISLPSIAVIPFIIYLHPELSWKSGLIGALLGAGFILALAGIYYLIKREEGVGLGDAKLLAVIGGWLGYESLFPTIFLSSILGTFISVAVLAINKKLSMKACVPFGPFLALGALIHFLSPVSLWSFLY